MGRDGDIKVGRVILKWVRFRDREGEACPPYVGYAYRNFHMDFIVYWIVPVNLIIAAWLWFVFRLRWGFHNSLESKINAARSVERRECVTAIGNYLLDRDLPMSAQHVFEWFHQNPRSGQ